MTEDMISSLESFGMTGKHWRKSSIWSSDHKRKKFTSKHHRDTVKPSINYKDILQYTIHGLKIVPILSGYLIPDDESDILQKLSQMRLIFDDTDAIVKDFQGDIESGMGDTVTLK
jgi:hypothetical protein